MLNFTVGPVMSEEEVLSAGALQTPYFRTAEFSKLMLENERLMLNLAGAPEGSRALFMTCSSTGSMEAAVMNCFDGNDSVLVISGGGFGDRFAQICEIHGVPHEVLRLEYGQGLSEERLCEYDGRGFTGLLVNVDETSTGVLYDTQMIGDFCRRNHIFLVCDCVSSFLADPFDMEGCGAGVMITGSQKALACPPGMSVILLSPEGLERVKRRRVRSLYFDLNMALKDMERGQTPFTPGVSILIQMNIRLSGIEKRGGAAAEIDRVRSLALDFRNRIEGLPFGMFSSAPANGVTSLCTTGTDAYSIFTRLKDEYGIWVCPNGGELKNRVFRVGHLGCLTINDNETLVKALRDMQKKGWLT